MHTYDVTVEARFIAKAKEPAEIRNRLLKVLKENNFEQKNFEIGINRIKGRSNGNNELSYQGETAGVTGDAGAASNGASVRGNKKPSAQHTRPNHGQYKTVRREDVSVGTRAQKKTR